MRKALYPFLLLCFSSFSEEPSFHYSAHIDTGGYGFNKSPHAALLGELFLPLYQHSTKLLYTDIRGLDKSGPAIEGNFSLGYRHLNLNHRLMLGLFSSYDIKRSSLKNRFQQVMMGTEAWLGNWFLGINGYLPIGKKEFFDGSFASAKVTSSGNYQNILYRFGKEAALPGFDTELGYEFIRGLTLYGGYYYYHRSSYPTITGPLGRLRYIFEPPRNSPFLKILDSITFETQIQHDHQRGTLWYGGLRLTWNLGKYNSSALSRIARHMIEPPLRDIDVVSKPFADPYQPLTTQNGSPINILTASTNLELNNALNNSNVQVIAINGSIANLSNVSVLEGQTLTGGTYRFTIQGYDFSLLLGNDGILTSAAGANLLILTANNTIENLNLHMLSPVNTSTANVAIGNNNGVDNMGTISIYNVQTNGRIFITRDGASKRGQLIVNSSVIHTGNWDPPGLSTVVEMVCTNSANSSCAFNENNIAGLNPTFNNQIVGLRLTAGASASLTVNSFTSNLIRGTDAGVTHQINGGAITYTSPFENNTIIGGATGRPGESGLLTFAFSSSLESTLNLPILKNNTLSGSSGGLGFNNFGSRGLIYELQEISENTITGDAQIITRRANDSVYIGQFKNNHIANAISLQVETAQYVIQVNDGNKGLSAANFNVPVQISGTQSPTIDPGP